MTTATPAQQSLYWLRHRRHWSRQEKRVMLVLLSGAPALSRDAIERAGRISRFSTITVTMVLTALAAHDLLGQTDLGHYWLTDLGRTFCLEVTGLA